MPMAGRRALRPLLLATCLGSGGAWADDVAVQVATIGDLQAAGSVRHDADEAHFCSAAPDPWADRAALDPRATPFPFYRVVFGQPSPRDELEGPGPSLGLAVSNYFAAARQHSARDLDSIELVIAGRHFVGHGGLDDPGYSLTVTFRDDGRGGGFAARRLHEIGAGGVIDVAGNWQCGAVAAPAPEVAVRAHALFAGAEKLVAEPTHLRLRHAGAPCRAPVCADWQVIDQSSGDAYRARVDLRRLRLAAALLARAEAGELELLVDASVAPGDPPTVTAALLAGVLPTDAPPPALSQPPPSTPPPSTPPSSTPRPARPRATDTAFR